MSALFKQKLAQLAPRAISMPADPEWKALASQVTQEVLDDANNNAQAAAFIFSSVGPLEARTRKQQSRIDKKNLEVSNRGGEFFKVVSDFIAFRVPCEVGEIEKVVAKVIEKTIQNNGTFWIKGSWVSTSDTNAQTFTDIVQYVYTYIPQIGYVVELQIGHPFAAYTFKVDSAIRDNPACGLTDLWKDNVYGKVKQHLLDVANKTPIFGGKYDAMDAVFTSHGGKVPDELKSILDRM